MRGNPCLWPVLASLPSPAPSTWSWGRSSLFTPSPGTAESRCGEEQGAPLKPRGLRPAPSLTGTGTEQQEMAPRNCPCLLCPSLFLRSIAPSDFSPSLGDPAPLSVRHPRRQEERPPLELALCRWGEGEQESALGWALGQPGRWCPADLCSGPGWVRKQDTRGPPTPGAGCQPEMNVGSKACWHAELGCEVLWKAWGKLHQS